MELLSRLNDMFKHSALSNRNIYFDCKTEYR